MNRQHEIQNSRETRHMIERATTRPTYVYVATRTFLWEARLPMETIAKHFRAHIPNFLKQL